METLYGRKRFFFVSLVIVGIVCFVILDWYVIHSDFFRIRIVRTIGEMMILPLVFIVQPTLLIFSIVYCIKDRFRITTFSFWSFFILLFSNLYCLGSFFYP